MYYDLISLMQFLSSNTFPTLNDIIAGTNATKRQTLYRLEKLNKLLKSEHAPILIFGTSPQKNIRIPEESKEAILRLLANADTSAADYYTRERRLLYMYLLIFIHNGYLSLTHFTDALKCSRSTILLDFKELKQLLKNENIEICNNRQKGYYFSGPETRIRRFMIEFVVNALSDSQGRRTLDRFIEDWGISLFSDSRKIITRLTKKHSIRLIEARLTEFIYIFIFLKERMQNGISAELYSFSNTEADAIPTLREYAFAVDLIREYSDTDRISERISCISLPGSSASLTEASMKIRWTVRLSAVSYRTSCSGLKQSAASTFITRTRSSNSFMRICVPLITGCFSAFLFSILSARR